MDEAFSVTGTSALSTDNLATPDSILAAVKSAGFASAAIDSSSALPDVRPWSGQVNYAPGSEDPTAVTFGHRNRDPFVIDLDPTGEKTVKFLNDRGQSGTTQTVLGAQLIGGLVKSREWLMERPEGQRLLAIIARDRAGKKRDFWEAAFDVGPSDLPFMSLVGTQAGSIAAAVRTADTFRKLQKGEQVTDDEALSATLAMAEARRAEDGTFGSTVGDILRAASGFMLEFLATGELGSLARIGAAKVAKGGIHLAMARTSKTLARELVEAEAIRAGAKTAEEMSKKGVLSRVAESVFKNTMEGNPLYRGMTDDAMRAMALKRAEYEAGKYVSRTAGGAVSRGFNSFLQWGENHISRGLLDFGAWGSEEATVAFSNHTTAGRALADAVGAFLVEAPLKGSVMWAANQYAAKPAIEALTGNERSVSRNQLSLMQRALFEGNEAVMADAEAISLGQDLLEYVSENAGRGFGSLLRAGGLAIDKAAAKVVGKSYVPLVTPASQVIRAEGAPLVSEEAGVSIGGKILDWVKKTLGTREDFNRRTLAGKSNAVIKALGVTSEADKEAIRTAVLNNSTAGLRRDLAARIGPDMGEFARNSVRTAFATARERYEAALASGVPGSVASKTYDDAVKDLSYKSFARFAVADYMARHGINPTGIMSLYSRMGYDGILGEMFEERYSDVAKGLFNLDESRWDGEKWWNLDFKQAVKNLYPGFDQLAAEAIGFAVPMVTRGIAMRMAAKAGGQGVINETKNVLSAFRDVTRTDEIFQMPKGDYLRAMDRVMEMSAKEIEDTKARIAQAESSGADEAQLAGMRANLEQLETVDKLRRERHTKWLTVDDIAKANADDLVSVTSVSDQRLLGPEGPRIPVYSSQETEQSAAGRNAMVDYSPKLARTLYEFQSSFEGEGQPWYRWFAQKAIGFAAGLATGDFSAMSGNAVEWHARDYGLSPYLCWQLKSGFAAEFERQRGILDKKAKEMAARGAEGTFAIRREDIMKAADEAFAPKARDIMSSYLTASNFRTFTQSRFRDQAILQYARENGYEYVTRDKDGKEIAPEFYKVNEDGSFDESSVLTAEQMEENARTRDEAGNIVTDGIAKLADDIAAATVNLMSRRVTRTEYAKSALLRLARLPQNFDGVSLATVESALALCGQERLANVIEADGTTPLKDLVSGSGVARVNMDVVSYIATKDKVEDVDPRAIESVAQSMGMRFDGSEEGLKKRNAEVYRLARLANATRNENIMYFSASTAKIEDWDPRVNSGNAFLVKAERLADGSYVLKTNIDSETGEIRPGEHSATFANRDALVAAMRVFGYEPATARIVFTQAKMIEFTDMYTALRDLNLIPEYVEACRSAGAIPHPMLLKHAGTKNDYVYSEDEAKAELERKMNLAARWNPDLNEAESIPDGATEDEVRKAYKELWDPRKGFMAIGERMLRSVGVRTDNPLARYAGEFRPYTRTRYALLLDSTRLSGDMSADIYVPVDAAAGYSYTTALFNAHLMDAFQKRPQFLKDAMGSVVSNFVEDVYDATEAVLRDPDVKKDDQLVGEIRRFQQAYLKQCDRPSKVEVRDPETGKVVRTVRKMIRGRELTPRSFTMLASQFAMFRAGKQDSTTEYARVCAMIAPLVYRSGNFIPFMNTVDLVLGGNGFLSEMIASGNKKDEVLGTQKGIRGLMAAAEGDPNAFRKAFIGSALTDGVTYDRFVAALVEAARKAPSTGLEKAPIRDGESARKAMREARASVDRKEYEESLTAVQKAAAEKVAIAEANLAAVQAERDEQTTKVVNLTEQAVKAQAAARETLADLTEAMGILSDVVGKDLEPDPAQRASVESLQTKYAAQMRELERFRAALRASLEGGASADAQSTPPARVDAEVAAAATEALAEPTDAEPTDADDVVGMAEENLGDVFRTVAGFGEFQEDLPPVFEERVDGDRLDIRFGAEQKLGRELTAAQAKLAVNMTVRAVLADGQSADEESVVDMAKRMFSSFSEDDIDAVREQYRALAAKFAAQDRNLAEVESVRTGDLWAEEDREDDDVSEDSFNEKSVAEFESEALGDFLALAWKASPETGRNFQAFVTNMREFVRWQLGALSDAAGVSDEAKAAVDFLNTFLNPRGNAVGKTMVERLSLFEKQLRTFDDDPGVIRKHVSQLLGKGASGRPLSRKGAMFLSYLLSLGRNDRNRFAILVSNSLATSAIHLDPSDSVPDEDKLFVQHSRGVSKTSESVITGSFASLAGQTRKSVSDVAVGLSLGLSKAIGDGPGFLSFDAEKDKDERAVEVIRANGAKVAKVLADAFGAETPIFSALTSPRALQYMARVMASGRSRKADKDAIRKLAEDLSVRRYSAAKVDTGVRMVDEILSTLKLLAKSGEGEISYGEVSTWFTATFATGDPMLGGRLTLAPSSSRITSSLMTLMSMYDSSLPETVVRADFDPWHSDRKSSVAVASRGMIPLANRFMDREFERLCVGLYGYGKDDAERRANFEKQLALWNPGKTAAQVMAECRSDMTWPDEFRTPIFAKSLSKDISAGEALAACQRTFDDKEAERFYVPIYAGDHSSAVLLQIPVRGANGRDMRRLLREDTDEGDAEAPVYDVFGNEIKSTTFTRKADYLCRLLGLGLLGTDAKRSALSSLEAEGMSMIGAKGEDAEGNPQFGENRIFIATSLDEGDGGADKGFTNEEMKGGILMYGYGANQLRSMAKDPDSMDVKAHLIGTGYEWPTFIKALACTSTGRERFAKGTALRAMQDWLEKQVRDEFSTGIFTDWDSYKIGAATNREILDDGSTVLDAIMDAVKAIHRTDPKATFNWSEADVDEKVGPLMVGGVERKVSEILPGVQVKSIDGLADDAVAVSLVDNSVIGYTVANVSHDSRVPAEPGRTPRNQTIDAVTWAASLMRLPGSSISSSAAQRAIDLVADWGVVASAVVSDQAFQDAMLASSSGIRELMRYGEDLEGQNVKAELVRVVNAQLRRNLNIPVNAIDAVLNTGGALLDKNGVMHDHTKDPTYAAMNRGSVWFGENERSFWGVDRQVPLWNCNVREAWFRYTWFLDEDAVAANEKWLRGQAEGKLNTKDYWADVPADVTDDRRFVHLFESIFTDLREEEANGPTARGAEIRAMISTLFVDQWGVTLSKRNDTHGKNYGVAAASVVSFDDLFHTMKGHPVFDRSAFRIDTAAGNDRIKLSSDPEGRYERGRIALGGTTIGLPRTPSYNALLVTGRAGLVASEEAPVEGVVGAGFMPGRSASVMPDPQTLDTEGIDHDGDKTKLYLMKPERGRVRFAQDLVSSLLDPNLAEDFVGNSASSVPERSFVRGRIRAALEAAGLLKRKYVTEDGRIKEASDEDEPHEGEFLAISDTARVRIANDFARTQFDMGLALPDADEGGKRTKPNARVPAVGSAAFHRTGPNSAVGDAGMTQIKSDSRIPEAVLKVKGPDGKPRNRIGKVRVATVVSDGAHDAQDSRANVVAIMKDLHFMWTTGMFFGENSVFNCDPSEVIRFLSFVGRSDGISNSTFDDMKEQICSRLGWRPGMMDVLFTDILANFRQETDPTTGEKTWVRGKLPATRDEFLSILTRFSVLINKKGSSRWWMDRMAAKQDSAAYAAAAKEIGDGRGRITYASVMDYFGIKYGEQKGEYALGDRPHPVAKAIYSREGNKGLAWIARAGYNRGHNPLAGYLMFLINRGDALKPSEIDQYVGFMRVHSAFREGRDFVSSFNYTNVDVGNDTESGRRDRVRDNFRKFVYEDEAGKKLRAVTEGGKFGSGYDILPALVKMNASMRAAYDVGNRLMTNAARGVLASERYELNAERLARYGGSEYAAVVAKSMMLDPIETFRTNRMRLEGNAQQVPYVLAGFQLFSDPRRLGIEGPSVRGAENLYNALHGMAERVASDDMAYATSLKDPNEKHTAVLMTRDSYVLAMRKGIEALFDVMYRLAVTSDEHRSSNNVFSYFREAPDRAFEARGKGHYDEQGNYVRGIERYGKTGEGLWRIMPSLGANTEASIAEIRRKVDLVIRGKSFSGKRTNKHLPRGYKADFTAGSYVVPGSDASPDLSFSLSKDSIKTMLEAQRADGKYVIEDDGLREELVIASKAISGMGVDEVTPAMMFGQLLPMYSVLTSRTVGAPTPSSPSILNLLPDRFYRELSAQQVANDRTTGSREIVDLLVPLNWAPRDRELYYRYGSDWYTKRTGTTRENVTKKTLAEAVEAIPVEARKVAGQAQGKMRKAIREIKKNLRNGDDAKATDRVDWRRNPDFRNTFDPFAANGLVLDAVKALSNPQDTMREVDRAPTVADAMRDGVEGDAPVKDREMRPDCARFARALGALCGSWAKVTYLGGDTFELRGDLRGDLATVVDGKVKRNHKAVILVSAGDPSFLNSEENVTAYANSYAYASSFAAATNFTTADGKPLTAERFMALPISVRKALVRKYGIGAAASNKAVWTLDGKGVATLCGAIRLNGDRSGTKIYHEYFHAMMRFYDALGVLTEYDRAEIAQFFNPDGSRGWTRETEERMAEGFRKWVVKNTEPPDTEAGRSVLSVFRRIMGFLKGLLSALGRSFTHGRELAADPKNPLIYRMAVHGIAQSSSYLTEGVHNFIADSPEYNNANPDPAIVAGQIRNRTRNLLNKDAVRPPATYSEDDVRNLLPEGAPESEVTETIQDLARGSRTLKYRKAKEYMDRLWARKNVPGMAIRELSERMSDPTVTTLGLRFDSVIDEDATIQLERKALDVLAAETATTADIREVIGQLVSARCAIAEAAGYEFSPDTDYATKAATEAAADPLMTVDPGTEEYKEEEIRTAADGGTLLKDRYSGEAAATLDSRLRNLVAANIAAGLEKDGRFEGAAVDVLRTMGSPKPSEALSDRNSVIVGIRAALQALAPEAEVSKELIEGSMAFEATLTMYQTLESSFRKKGDRSVYGEGASRWKQYASSFDVAAWILSGHMTTPGALLESALRKIAELRDRYATDTPGYGEIEYLHDAFWNLRRKLSDPTGLSQYRRGDLAYIMDDVFKQIRAGLMPADAEQGSDPATWSYIDSEGFQKDLKPVMPSESDGMIRSEAEGAATHRALLQGCVEDPAVQEALKLALRTAYELAAMVKYMGELQDVPPTAEDVAYANEMAKRGYAKSVGETDWFASQSLSSSFLLDNRNLVDHYDQSYFIAADPDTWLASQVRRTFGTLSLKDMNLAEHREFGAIKSEILNLENYYSFLFGDNVEANGEILKLMEQDREFSMEFGTVVHGQFGKALKFDNYHRVGSGVRMTHEDLRFVDLFKKTAKAHFQRQRSVVTGVNRLMFSTKMSTDPKDYTKEAIEKLEEDTRLRKGRPLNPFEESLWRLSWQLPEEILFGKVNLYGRLVDAACTAMKEAGAINRDEQNRPAGFDFNTHVLRKLEAAGLCVAELNGKKAHDNKPGLRRGVVVMPVRDYLDFWNASPTLDKLAKARMLPGEKNDTEARKRLSLEAYERDMATVWRKAAKFARRHAWLTEGDGKFLNMFGTCLPFFTGSGVFMYAANRRDRAEKRSYLRNLSKYERAFANSVVGDAAKARVDTGGAEELLYFLHDMYDTKETGQELGEAIATGKYEAGPNNDTGLVLSRDATRGDVADAIYTKLLERADREEAGLPAKGDRRFESGDRILKIYEEARGAASDMFGGATGLNDEQMFRLHGVLPSNDQLGHAVHKSIDGITNAIMQRNVLVNMLMTPNADGAPTYYARPDGLAVQTSGLPDELWENVARWWCDWNGLTYDGTKSGVENAQRVYDLVNANAQENRGLVTLTPPGAGDRDYRRAHRYTEFPKSESDLVSVQSWLVINDEERGDGNSFLDGLSGGEAMGYLRQFCQASRVLGFGGAKMRATLHRVLSWSKSMSVSFSFFFPLATKWESPIGAVGAMATIASNRAFGGRLARSNPELFNAVQKMFGGAGWITKDFLGFTDVIRMMDSNDPFLAELISWAEALGVKISDRYVNPVEPTRGLVDSDIRLLKRMLAEHMSPEAAAAFGRKMDLLFSRSSEKSFSYALNATKLATVAQLCMKLRAEAAKRGKAFDPVRDLRQYSGYINAEIGGIDPLRYAWATPRFRGFMNALLFSWEWTRGAWEAGGGTVLEDVFLGGHATTPEEREFYRGRWARMFGEVMIGVPMMIQMIAWSLAKLASDFLPDDWFQPGDDERRKKLKDYIDRSSPFTWDNEEKTRWTAADLTPLLKLIGSANVGWLPLVGENTTVAEMKTRHPFALWWLPAYTGMDSANSKKTRNRRLYLHFGKQGWEELRWFDDLGQQFFSKLSMPTQRLLEGVFGRNLGYLDRALPWEDKGLIQRFTDPSFDGALWNLASAFLPFSVSGIVRTGDAGIIPVFGPVQYGASYTAVNDRIVDRLTAFAENDRRYYTRGYRHKGKIANWSQNMLSDILADARANGVPDKDLSTLVATAAGQVKGKLYSRLWELIPENPADDFDAAAINRVARSIHRLGGTYDSMMDSLKKTIGGREESWKSLTPVQREMYRTVLRGFKPNPYNDRALEERMEAVRESVTKPMDY